MGKNETPQEFADRQYAEGCRDAKCDAIETLLDLVQYDEMDYIFNRVEETIIKAKRKRYDKKWGQ